MANRRMMSSELFLDDVFIKLDDITRLVWIGLIVAVADDQGRMQDNYLLIRSQIFPADTKNPARIATSIDVLIKEGLLHRYSKKGKKLLQIVNWWKHQTPSWASASAYPPPDRWVDREKYHALGNKVEVKNWDAQGGFSLLPTTLPTRVGSLYGESDVKSDVKSDCEGNSLVEQPAEKEEDLASAFVEVFSNLTGLKPKKTEEEIEMVDRFVKLGITPDEYGKAIQQMQAKPYKIATMKSPEKWVMNNHNVKPASGSYEAWGGAR
jgi:hypothetical protein